MSQGTHKYSNAYKELFFKEKYSTIFNRKMVLDYGYMMCCIISMHVYPSFCKYDTL